MIEPYLGWWKVSSWMLFNIISLRLTFLLVHSQGSQPMPMETSRTTSRCCIHENETRTQSAELDKDNSERTMLGPQFTRYIYRTSRLLEMYGKMIWCALNLFGNVLFFVSSIPSIFPASTMRPEIFAFPCGFFLEIKYYFLGWRTCLHSQSVSFSLWGEC